MENSQTNPNAQQNDSERQKLVEVDVNDENVALNVLVGFCNLAQQRGVFNLQESAKIWECIKKFQKN
tara:strand:+ start:1539 stop:1739 length:201 start_codon:yes stop_codon:yes gene_type:complete